jgi:hypothetical protein
MSSVKNNGDIGKALGNLWNTTVKEGQRSLDEAGKLMTESINDIGKATQTGGFVGATLQAFEELSPGNVAAGAVDVLTGPGQLNPQLAAGIRGAVNFTVGTIVPGAGLPLQVSALVDAARAFGMMGGAPMTPGAGQSPAARQTQTPERPADAGERQLSPREQQEARAAKRKAIDEAKQQAREQIREKAQNNRIGALEDRVAYLEKLLGVTEGRPAGGYSPVDDIGDVDGGFGRIDFDKLKPGRLKDDVDTANSEIDKILNNPNLSFEDMIFLLMSAIMKQQQGEIREMTKELRGKKEKFEGTKAGLRANVDKAEKAVFDAQAKVNKNPNDDGAAKGLADARANLRAAEAELGDSTTEFNDSRAEQFELIKNAMQKLTEMQQALSNILNTMHQTAMNTIGNIR